MGMFDDVVPPSPIPCPGCGNPLVAFQSKDAECVLRRITDLREIDHFYTSCPKCNAWVDVVRKVDRHNDLTDFEVRGTNGGGAP